MLETSNSVPKSLHRIHLIHTFITKGIEINEVRSGHKFKGTTNMPGFVWPVRWTTGRLLADVNAPTLGDALARGKGRGPVFLTDPWSAMDPATVQNME